MTGTTASAFTPPEGFTPLPSISAFVQRAGTFYVRDDPDGVVGGTYVGQDQSNSDGVAHGGFLMTFADFVMSKATFSITINLTADFMRAARVGDWIELKVHVRKRSASLLFADGVVICGDKELMRINGVFKPLERS